jgi:hypothetical protein
MAPASGVPSGIGLCTLSASPTEAVNGISTSSGVVRIAGD